MNFFNLSKVFELCTQINMTFTHTHKTGYIPNQTVEKPRFCKDAKLSTTSWNKFETISFGL